MTPDSLSPTPPAPRVAALGECMIELRDRPAGCRIDFGGDTLNTALYLSRLGTAVDYVTVLGDDPYSEAMLAAWREEGIGTAHVRQAPGRLPGLYAIRTDAAGERRFFYWRDRAPARELFRPPHGERLCETLAGYDLLYLSGISVSILDEPQRETLLGALAAARARGATVAFDPNYRPAGWTSPAEAAAWFERVYRHTSIALPTLDDERSLAAGTNALAVAERLLAAGIPEVAVKQGAAGCTLASAQGTTLVPVPAAVDCIDTTAAGDSFNAAYLAARLRGEPPEAAALAGHRLAGAVVGRPGAIIPRHAMPADLRGTEAAMSDEAAP
jgi:2-dehydro-3-deoxygluconokinase